MSDLTSWSTACDGYGTESSAQELSLLGEQLARCGVGRRWFALCCGAEFLHGFVLARLVSTALVLALLLGVGWLAW